MMIIRTLLIFGVCLMLFSACEMPKKNTPSLDLTTVIDSALFYERQWAKYTDEDGNVLRMNEFYVSLKGDTVYGQEFIFKNNEVDTVKSTFYELEWSWDNDSLLRGSILFFDPPVGDGPVSNKVFRVVFTNAWKDSLKQERFEVFDRNTISFEFKSNSDALIGGLYFEKFTDNGKIQNGEKMLDYNRLKIPVSNKTKAFNVFNTTFKKKD